MRLLGKNPQQFSANHAGITGDFRDQAPHVTAHLFLRRMIIGICHLQACRVFPFLTPVKAIWQATTCIILGMASVRGEEPKPNFNWQPLRIQNSLFTRDLAMLDTEREEYATNLASVAVQGIVTDKASPQSLSEARRLLALALHLSPRNKRAIVVNFQLSKGMLPEVIDRDYTPQVFARLLLTRGQLLAKEEAAQNQELARIFIHLSAVLDPKNEDAIYASEVDRLDHGTPDWSRITDPAAKADSDESPEVPGLRSRHEPKGEE